MSTSEIILIAALFAVAGILLYRKYVKKDTGKSVAGNKKEPGSSFPYVSKDDDYEPYSGK